MKKNPLLGALPIIAQALGRQRGVQVVIGGFQAFTDFKTITIPALPPDGQQATILANGYIDHESAHIRYTDPACLKPPGLVGVLLNVFEDIRVEQALSQAYPGSRHNLAALVAALEAEKPSAPDPSADLIEQVVMGLLVILRTQLLGQTALAVTAAVMEARLASCLSDAVWNPLRALAFEIQSAQSTQDALGLAEGVVHLLTQAATNAAAPKEGEGDAADATSQDGPCAVGHAADAAPLTPSQVQALTALVATTAPVPAADVGARAAAALNTQATAHDAVTMANYESPPPHQAAQGLLHEVRAATSALRRRLAQVVHARCQATTVLGRRGRQLDGAALYRLTVGDPRVFCHRTEGEALDTAISVLLDRSGSMDVFLALASQAVLALALALDEMPGVICQVAAFPGTCEDLLPLKGSNERTARVAGRFRLTASGNTPLAAALWRVAFDLTSQRVARRCVIVITDGQPDDPAATRDIIARCRQSGIEVVGLGVGLSLSKTQAVFGVADAQAIATIRAMAPALFALLAQRLTVAA